MSTPVDNEQEPTQSSSTPPLEVLIEVVLPSAEEDDVARGPAGFDARSRAVLREVLGNAVDVAFDGENENEDEGLRIPLLSQNDDDGMPPPPTTGRVSQLQELQEASARAHATSERSRAHAIARMQAVMTAREEVATARLGVEAARQDVADARDAMAATDPTPAPTREEVQEPTEPTSASTSEVQIQPILSSIRDLRSALHQRVLTLGQEVEQLRARAAAVERGFADNRSQRQRVHNQMGDARMVALLAGEGEEVGGGDVSSLGEGPSLDQPGVNDERDATGIRQEDRLGVGHSGPWSLSSLVNRVSASQPGIHERNREEGRYEVVKGSGSAEIEGSKEERRQRRLNQVKSESVSAASCKQPARWEHSVVGTSSSDHFLASVENLVDPTRIKSIPRCAPSKGRTAFDETVPGQLGLG